jgi:cytoskeletal protein CcmA (bactofilin family)
LNSNYENPAGTVLSEFQGRGIEKEMIRMGKSSKYEDPSEKSRPQETFNNTNGSLYATESVLRTDGKVVSESESMARDIKEGRLSGYVGNGTTLTGETSFQSMLRVDGHLTGKVNSEKGTLIIGTDGQVDADIEVMSAVVNGAVNGDITASEKIELGRAAKVVGNITSPQVVIEPGAIFEGSCHMLKARDARDEREAQSRSYIHTSNPPISYEEPVSDTSISSDTEEEAEETLASSVVL